MNSHALFSMCLAGMAFPCAAQNFTLWLEPSSITPSGTFTVSVYGDADVGDGYYAAAFGLEVTSSSGHGGVQDIEWAPGVWAGISSDEGGYLGNGLHSLVWMSQLVIPSCGVFSDCTVPYGTLMATFTIEVDPERAETYQLDLIPAPTLNPDFAYSIEVVDEQYSNYWTDSQGTLSLQGATITVVPASAGLGSLLLCGLLASRRTRMEV